MIVPSLSALILSGLLTFLSETEATLLVHFLGSKYCPTLLSVRVMALASQLDGCIDHWAGWVISGSPLGDSMRTNFGIGHMSRLGQLWVAPTLG